MNVLLSCVGRRGYLVRYFQEALAGRGLVITTNTIADTPGMLAADRAIVVPPTTHPGYARHVFKLCREHEVGLICSLFDLDLAVLGTARPDFIAAGIAAAISPSAVVATCFDKWQTYQFALSHRVSAPRTYLSVGDALDAVTARKESFPLVVKPRWGTGSIAVEVAYDERDLQAVAHHVREVTSHSYLEPVHRCAAGGGVLVQELVSGTEYGVDIVNDLGGEFACCFVKEKQGMRSGETDAAVTVEDGEIAAMGERIARALRHVGPLDADVIRDGERVCLLELNPRFGGHYPFSHLAGANIPAALIAWAEGMKPDSAWLQVRSGVLACKDIVPVLSYEGNHWTNPCHETRIQRT